MRKISLFIAAFAIIFVLIAGCATMNTTMQKQKIEQYRSFTMAFAQNGESITKTFLLPLEFPDLNGVESDFSDIIYTQFYIVVWGIGDNGFGLIFDKFSSDLVGAGAVGVDYVDYAPYGMKAWIYFGEKDLPDIPIECTVIEQDRWLQEMDYELSQRNRMSI